MDKLTIYKSVVQGIMDTIVEDFQSATQPFHMQMIKDDVHGQYLLFQNDWHNERRLYGPILHMEVASSGKVWIHYDGTDLVVAEQLLEAGIPKEDIVLGFRSPVVRPDTGFAMA